MCRWLTLLFTCQFVVMGCQRQEEQPTWPPFMMSIPDDVPEWMIVTDKDGVEHEVNGKELWVDGYRAGWKRCLWDYESGHLDLAAEDVEPPPLGHYSIVARGWNEGYRACWEAIRAEMSVRE
jgi:hypothetical protein